jgi:hypothetical protein
MSLDETTKKRILGNHAQFKAYHIKLYIKKKQIHQMTLLDEDTLLQRYRVLKPNTSQCNGLQVHSPINILRKPTPLHILKLRYWLKQKQEFHANHMGRYKIDRIVNHRIGEVTVEYEVKWKGYTSQVNTWEKVDVVENTKALKRWEKKAGRFIYYPKNAVGHRWMLVGKDRKGVDRLSYWRY